MCVKKIGKTGDAWIKYYKHQKWSLATNKKCIIIYKHTIYTRPPVKNCNNNYFKLTILISYIFPSITKNALNEYTV